MYNEANGQEPTLWGDGYQNQKSISQKNKTENVLCQRHCCKHPQGLWVGGVLSTHYVRYTENNDYQTPPLHPGSRSTVIGVKSNTTKLRCFLCPGLMMMERSKIVDIREEKSMKKFGYSLGGGRGVEQRKLFAFTTTTSYRVGLDEYLFSSRRSWLACSHFRPCQFR